MKENPKDKPRQVIQSVAAGSVAQELDMRPGDVLLQINGTPCRDFVDFAFFTSEPAFTLTVEKPDGQVIDYQVEKEDWEPLGLSFANSFMDRQMPCQNKCVFCFIDQMPPHMRKTLYFKDDDWRLSLMMGNYVTLTNLDESEFQRVIDRRVTPLYLSVHATDPAARQRMIQNPKADILPRLQRLCEARLPFHTQIVLCPGYNDGDVLKKTLFDLTALRPVLRSVAVVPVGITRFREGLAPLMPVTQEIARKTLEQIKEANGADTPFAFGADELYLKAGIPFPPPSHYGGYEQIEDGIGMVAKFTDELLSRHIDRVDSDVGVVTGTLFAPVLRKLLARLPENHIPVYAIENDYFGHTITVAGLVTGGDIIRQLKGKALPSRLLIPDTMLRHEGDLFLDDVTVQDVETALGRRVQVTSSDGASFLQAIQREE